MKRILEMKFIKEDGKTTTISFDNIKDNVTDTDIKNLMDFIVTKNIFTFKGVGISEKKEAKIINVDTHNVYID
ncbi:Protein of unknown function [Alkalithermobacter thermoalcaliphilus JW-YL-7 = DSM 7308]|uniref:DUF2922 domain-containing protein n=1 Tax=Alkalithermobacter thermoalcaliphilus JW-YL-7 = DSM 7308 TaxID=1121328 RepID=A0A150FSH1_CLOPD|nr:Protein of unknown function DUF2922 [[Clostridium] paradoxum JW-YL-7 = DSM 7308]SHK70693.1 Protein of unknown function [[Clostridium] paradoxum JW-YL-7 = DSM 7308]